MRISALNFKVQVHIDPKDNIQRAQLYFLNYDLSEQENGAKIYTRLKQPAISPESKKTEEL